jgi:hypothetical protein
MQRNFTKNFVGSGIQKKIHSGSRIQGVKKHRNPDRQHWTIHVSLKNDLLIFLQCADLIYIICELVVTEMQ